MSEAVERRIDQIMGTLSLEDKIGQCLTMSFFGHAIKPHERRFVEGLKAGGLRVTPHTTSVVSNDAAQFFHNKLAPHVTPVEYARAIRQLQDMAMERNGIPLHVVTDQEGDLSIDIIRGGMNLFPSNCGIAATGDVDLAYRSALAIARQLRAQGINWMHSPEVDVNVQPQNPEVGMRAFSDDPEICARFGIAMAKGFFDGGVMPTAKHFPGRGDSITDAHDVLDSCDKSKDQLWAVELYPYQKMIEACDVFAIMTAHTGFPAYDPGEVIPASLSANINKKLIREELGFDGVVTTDAIYMQSVIDYAKSGSAASLMALIAGADLVLLKAREDVSVETVELIKNAVKSGKLTEDELDQKVMRILRAKFELGLFEDLKGDACKVDDGGCKFDPEKAMAPIKDETIRATTREVFERGAIVCRDPQGLLPVSKTEKILVVEQHIPLYHDKCNDIHYHAGMFGEFMRELGPGDELLSIETNTPADEQDAEIFNARLGQVDMVVFSNIFWRGSGSNRPFIRQAVKAGKKVVVVCNDLYDNLYLPESVTVICTFGAVPLGQRVGAEIVYGQTKAQGQWPMRLIAQEQIEADKEVDHFIAGHFSSR